MIFRLIFKTLKSNCEVLVLNWRISHVLRGLFLVPPVRAKCNMADNGSYIHYSGNWYSHSTCADFCDSDEDSDDESKDEHKDGPDSSKISTTTDDGKDHEASPAKGHPFSNSDSGSRTRDSGPRTEKSQADSRQSPVTVISSTTRSGEDLKSPNLDQPKTDECRSISKDNFMPLTVQTDSTHIGHGHLHNFGFPTGLTGQQFFNHLGSAHPFLLHPSQFNMGGAFTNMAAGMGPLLAAVSTGGVSTMDTTSMASPPQSLTGAPGLPFHLQQHVLASQVKPVFLGLLAVSYQADIEFYGAAAYKPRLIRCRNVFNGILILCMRVRACACGQRVSVCFVFLPNRLVLRVQLGNCIGPTRLLEIVFYHLSL